MGARSEFGEVALPPEPQTLSDLSQTQLQKAVSQNKLTFSGEDQTNKYNNLKTDMALTKQLFCLFLVLFLNN